MQDLAPDGQSVITNSFDATVRIWPVNSLPSLLEWGCMWINDYIETKLDVMENHVKICQKNRMKSLKSKSIERINRIFQ